MGKPPTEKLSEELNENPKYVSETISCLMDLGRNGKPKNCEELKQRIDGYFLYCAEHGLKPGIETLCLALDCDRRSFWSWCVGVRSHVEEWQNICIRARQSIIAFMESAMYSGKVSPPVAIFTMKNVAGWRDTLTVEDYLPQVEAETNTVEVLPTFAIPDEKGEKNDDE